LAKQEYINLRPYREAVRYVEKQLKCFRRLCSRLAASADLVAGLEESMERIARPMRGCDVQEPAGSLRCPDGSKERLA